MLCVNLKGKIIQLGTNVTICEESNHRNNAPSSQPKYLRLSFASTMIKFLRWPHDLFLLVTSWLQALSKCSYSVGNDSNNARPLMQKENANERKVMQIMILLGNMTHGLRNMKAAVLRHPRQFRSSK